MNIKQILNAIKIMNSKGMSLGFLVILIIIVTLTIFTIVMVTTTSHETGGLFSRLLG